MWPNVGCSAVLAQIKFIVVLCASQQTNCLRTMNTLVATGLKVVLGIAIILLGYNLYSIIQKPIQYQKLENKRYAKVKERLEQIREVQKAFRAEYKVFTGDLDQLVAFVDTGRRTIIERKDSSFMRYNETYLKDMQVDTIITRVLGYEPVKEFLFDSSFKHEQLRYIPFSENEEFIMDAGKITVGDVVVPVFEAKAPDSLIFADVINRFGDLIDTEHYLAVGSMDNATLNGNWK